MAYKVWIHIEDTETDKDVPGCLPVMGPVFDKLQAAIEYAEGMEG